MIHIGLGGSLAKVAGDSKVGTVISIMTREWEWGQEDLKT